MLSLSLGFHIVSALGLSFLIWRLAVLSTQISFIRTWIGPRNSKIVVGEAFRKLHTFCDALDIPCKQASTLKGPIVKVSISGLMRLHQDCWISEVVIPQDNTGPVTFNVRTSSDTIDQYQTQIERDFSQAFRVHINYSK